MKNQLIAERYARGLNAAIADTAELPAAMDAMSELSELYETDHDLRAALANPTIDIAKRVAVLDDITAKAAPPHVVARLLEVLLRRGRITLLTNVSEEFAHLADERLNRVAARVTSPIELNETSKQRLQDKLAAFSGKDVRVKYTIDPEILGGVIARIDGVVIDGSIRSQLERLKQQVLS